MAVDLDAVQREIVRAFADHDQIGGGHFCSCTDEDDDGLRAPIRESWDVHFARAVAAALSGDPKEGQQLRRETPQKYLARIREEFDV